MMQLDATIVFALGALCMFCLALIVALGVGTWLFASLFSWAKKHVSGFDEIGATREDGKVSLGAQLVDLERKGSRGRKTKGPRTAAELMRADRKDRPS
jgi:hypothetical protein